jgi:hypothetical protein
MASRHPTPQRKLERRVAIKLRRTLTILNRLDDVKQRFEKDYLRKLNMKYDGTGPTIVNRIKAIEKNVSIVEATGELGRQFDGLRRPPSILEFVGVYACLSSLLHRT